MSERHGSPTFYELIDKMAAVHSMKSHDYASNLDPYGNYHFAGMLSKLFNNPDDAGFIGRIGEKIFRLANLENDGKLPENEAISDTELDICVITALWMASRRDRRMKNYINNINNNNYINNINDDELRKDIEIEKDTRYLCQFCGKEIIVTVKTGELYRYNKRANIYAHNACYLKASPSDVSLFNNR